MTMEEFMSYTAKHFEETLRITELKELNRLKEKYG